MKPNVKSFLGGAIVIALIWAISAFAGGTDTGTNTEAELSSSEVATAANDGNETGADPDADDTADADVTADAEEPADAGEPAADPDPSSVSSGRFSDLPTIAPGELSIEAIDTLDLIASGGPFPYSKDDSVFQNREGILPDQTTGHYREYTVDTPGESDRGARRIVAGAEGALYYTDDHYDSFREIVFGQ